MNELIPLILKLALMLLPRLLKDPKAAEETRRNVEAALASYQRATLDPAKLRKESKDLDPRLREKWQERWGKKS